MTRAVPMGRFSCLSGLLAGVACAGIVNTAHAQEAKPPAKPTLRTKWAASVTPANVHPEYPRPQLVRTRWTNLNGNWEYAIRDTSAGTPDKYEGSILVPFAVESQLSGVQRTVTPTQYLWYRRTFRAPARANGERLLLHFGAVDWKTTVYVNGREVGMHEGGFDPFSVDITDALASGSGEQTLVVRVWDPTDAGAQPRGKQVQQPGGIFYTSVTGIWQTVWLEPVSATYIAGLKTTTNIDAGTVTVRLTPGAIAPAGDATWQVTALAKGGSVAQATGRASDSLVLRIPKARLWSPSDPFLYDLKVTLKSGGSQDAVSSYVGLREISSCRDEAGILRLCLNHKPGFQYGPLDQGWWPDGLYTAPNDEALKFDIEKTKELGFNMIRKHIKVEPARWYYYADKLGMLVWQDMPSGDNNTAVGKAASRTELRRMVDVLHNHPSIVVWVPFNEGWGQHDTERVTAWIKGYDPTRLVDHASGWTDMRVGDMSDAHVYPGPGMPPADSTRVLVLGEFGGLGLPLKGHVWVDQANWGYATFTTEAALDTAYRKLVDQLRPFIADGLSAAVYTQTTDVETEVNGLMTYDRSVLKLPASIASAHATLYAPIAPRRTIVPLSWRSAQQWQYTFDTPDTTWANADYNAGSWKTGMGGFGQPVQPGYARAPVKIGTRWETPEIWTRRTFTIDSATVADTNAAFSWRLDCMNEVELYLNGKSVGHVGGGTSGAMSFPFNAKARAAIRAGTNTLAVYSRRSRPLPTWQFFDVGIDVEKSNQAGRTPKP